jgi:hypothetical protein
MKKISTRHRWGERVECGPHKSEKQCVRCGVVRASMHQNQGAHDEHWKEFWRDEELISREKTPLCDARLERTPDAAPREAVPA